MRRGDIYWADLGPPAGRRPVLILTRTAAIGVLSGVVVAPVTRTIRGILSEVGLGAEDGLGEECVANVDSLFTVPTTAFDPEAAGTLSAAKIAALDRALRFALEIEF